MNVMIHPSGYRIGAATVTTDGEPGIVRALVVDPVTRNVTHIAVEPRHQHHQARLVPIDIVTAEPNGDVRIARDRAGFDELDGLEHLELVDVGPYPAYGFYGPYGLYGPYGYDEVAGCQRLAVWTDRPPDGETALRHGTPVYTGGDTVGHLDGLLAGPDGHITALLVANGHPWSRRTVAIPVDAVTAVDEDRLTIAATWDQLRSRT